MTRRGAGWKRPGFRGDWSRSPTTRRWWWMSRTTNCRRRCWPQALRAQFGSDGRRLILVVGLSRHHDPEPFLAPLAALRPALLIATAPAFHPRPASEVAAAARRYDMAQRSGRGHRRRRRCPRGLVSGRAGRFDLRHRLVLHGGRCAARALVCNCSRKFASRKEHLIMLPHQGFVAATVSGLSIVITLGFLIGIHAPGEEVSGDERQRRALGRSYPGSLNARHPSLGRKGDERRRSGKRPRSCSFLHRPSLRGRVASF